MCSRCQWDLRQYCGGIDPSFEKLFSTQNFNHQNLTTLVYSHMLGNKASYVKSVAMGQWVTDGHIW